MAERDEDSADDRMDRPEAALGFLLNQAAGVVRERTAAALAPVDLHPREFGILLAISHRPGISQIETSQQLRIDRTTMSQLVNSLTERKLVKRAVSCDDRRNHRLDLTSQGARVLRRATSLAERVERDLTQPLTVRQRAALKSSLLALLENA